MPKEIIWKEDITRVGGAFLEKAKIEAAREQAVQTQLMGLALDNLSNKLTELIESLKQK